MSNKILIIWIHYPSSIYFAYIFIYHLICFILHATQASAGGLVQVNDVMLTHQGWGLQRLIAGNVINLEAYQHMRNISAWYNSGLHEQGWRYLILQRNEFTEYMPDSILTNNSELITNQFKTARSQELAWTRTHNYFTNYAAATDVLQIECIHNSVFAEIINRLFPDLEIKNITQPQAVVHPLNVHEEVTPHQLENMNKALALYKQSYDIIEYRKINTMFNNYMQGDDIHK